MRLFKKSISAIISLALAVTCLSSVTLPTAVAYAEPENIAPQGVGFDSNTDGLDVSGSKNEDNIYYAGTANQDNLNDGGISDSSDDCWQYAKNDKNGGTYDISNVYCGIKFEVPVYVTKFSVLGIVGVTTANGGDGFVPDNYSLSYYDGAAWHTVTDTVDGTSVYHEFAEETKLYAVKIEFTKRYAYHPKVAEIYVYGRMGGVEVAKATLSATLDRAGAIESSAFTAESWAILQNAVNNANALDLDAAAEDEILAAAQAVDDAISALKPLLLEAIDAASVYNATYYLYSQSSYASLRNTVNTAVNLINSGSTDASTLNAASNAIYSAIDAMLLTTGNIAPLGTAYADSNYADDKPAENVNDGAVSTRWQSKTSTNSGDAWIMIDFGAATSMNIFEICWEVNRAGANDYTIQYSDDNSTWNNATGVKTSDFTKVPVPESSDSNYYYQSVTMDTVSARYIRLYITNTADSSKTNPSIHEWEIYYNIFGDFGTQGAQIRDNASGNGNYDLRFVSNISEEYYTTYVLGINSVGVLIARADQLKNDELTFQTMDTASYKVANLKATYFNNSSTSQTGDYVYASAILNISNIDKNYVVRSYIRYNDGGVIYGEPVMRCVRDGL